MTRTPRGGGHEIVRTLHAGGAPAASGADPRRSDGATVLPSRPARSTPLPFVSSNVDCGKTAVPGVAEIAEIRLPPDLDGEYPIDLSNVDCDLRFGIRAVTGVRRR